MTSVGSLAVIPGLREAKSPEPGTDAVAMMGSLTRARAHGNGIGSGLRARACGVPRNDDGAEA